MADPVPAYLDPSVSTPAFFTDVYEYTMLEAARRDGTADRRCVFEVYARHLPAGRRYGIVAGFYLFVIEARGVQGYEKCLDLFIQSGDEHALCAQFVIAVSHRTAGPGA